MKRYNVQRDGIVNAVRIYIDEHATPYADLILAFGGKRTIRWTDVEQRKEYAPGINGYTLFYDERNKRPFDEWNWSKG